MNRTQQVCVDNSLSNTRSVISGVPQGSVLGPILFLIFINDLTSVLSGSVVSKFFADDVKLYTEILSQYDYLNLQACLDRLKEWARIWQLIISKPKCLLMDLGNPNDYAIDNFIDGTKLASVVNTCDLGVDFKSNLSFERHIDRLVARAKRNVYLLFRAIASKNIHNLLIGFKAYVLPIVDYCCQVWSPYHVKYILAVESVQRVFTKRLPGLRDHSYIDRLKALNLCTLERRRLESDLVLCYKILHGHVAGTPEKFGLKLSNRRSRGHSLKLNVELSRVNVRRFFLRIG